MRNDIIEWLNFLRKDVGFDGWRFDFVRGWPGHFAKQYIEATDPTFALGKLSFRSSACLWKDVYSAHLWVCAHLRIGHTCGRM